MRSGASLRLRLNRLWLLLGLVVLVSACNLPAVPDATATPRQTVTATQTTTPTVSPTVTVTFTPAPTATPTVTPTATQRPFEPGLYGQTLYDFHTCDAPDGTPLHMDVHFPSSGEPPFPTVIFVHGGSWIGGNKSSARDILENTSLIEGGNLFISVEYRLGPEHPFPAMIEDVKCAIRMIRYNHDPLYVDPQRIAVMGISAGGHLASLVGVAGPEAGWDAGQYPDTSSRVSAVIDLMGPSEATGVASGGDTIVRMAFGVSNVHDPILQQYSPLAYVSEDDPPFLVIHGVDDTTVPISQSQMLVEALEAGGVPVTYIPVVSMGHGLPYGMYSEPGYDQLMQAMRVFLEEHIGRGTP